MPNTCPSIRQTGEAKSNSKSRFSAFFLGPTKFPQYGSQCFRKIIPGARLPTHFDIVLGPEGSSRVRRHFDSAAEQGDRISRLVKQHCEMRSERIRQLQ